MSNFTAGPWHVDGGRISSQDVEGIAEIGWLWPDGGTQASANANLIAAAPEMYEALREIQECLEDHGRFNLLSPAVATALDIARAALAKADGKK